MSLITTTDGRTILKKAESMMAVPYVYDSTVGDYVLGSDVYDISAIIGDSITLEQSDGNTTTKENEFIGSPLLEAVSGSKFAFTSQCVDLQNSVLKSLFGAMTVSGVEGAVAFHDDFVLRYALIRIRFTDATLPDVLLPKVQLNSKLFINQLKTRLSQGNIAGTALPRYVAVTESLTTNAIAFNDPVDSTTTYKPYTPVVLVPRGKMSLVFHRKRSSADVYASVDFQNGSVRSDIAVSDSGTISIL